MISTSLWRGVIPAITTPFTAEGNVDHAFLARHAIMLVEAGCRAIVPLGSLGEAATLSYAEKTAVLRTLVHALAGRAPVIPGVAALSTDEAVRLAARGDGHRLQRSHGAAALCLFHRLAGDAVARRGRDRCDDLPCMLYNNPIAYRTDFTPANIAELAAQFANLAAVKESSGDLRRFAAIRALTGYRLELLVGIDDGIVEGVGMGAVGWIAGLVNAYPKESVRLFELARSGGSDAALALYSWFLPLLRMDTVPKFVQLIKLCQEKSGWGSERVRAPRLVLEGDERAAAIAVIDQANIARPTLD